MGYKWRSITKASTYIKTFLVFFVKVHQSTPEITVNKTRHPEISLKYEVEKYQELQNASRQGIKGGREDAEYEALERTCQNLQEEMCNLLRDSASLRSVKPWGTVYSMAVCVLLQEHPGQPAALCSQQLTVSIFPFRIYVSFFDISAGNVGWNNTTFA